MDRHEYQKWVDYVISKGFKKPRIIIECINNYDRWQSRLSLARYLIHDDYKQYQPALVIYEDILQNHLDFKCNDDKHKSIEYIEQKVWTLRDAAKLQWEVNKDCSRAISYINLALSLIHNYRLVSRIVSGGEIWRQKLEILRELNKTEEIAQEIRIIKKFKKSRDLKSNSYLFNAYYFSSILYKEQGDISNALTSMKQALNYFPLYQLEESNENLKRIWQEREMDALGAYTSMVEITKNKVFWEM